MTDFGQNRNRSTTGLGNVQNEQPWHNIVATSDAVGLVRVVFEGGGQQFFGLARSAQPARGFGLVQRCVQRTRVDAQRPVAVALRLVHQTQVDFGQRPVRVQHAAVFAHFDRLQRSVFFFFYFVFLHSKRPPPPPETRIRPVTPPARPLWSNSASIGTGRNFNSFFLYRDRSPRRVTTIPPPS